MAKVSETQGKLLIHEFLTSTLTCLDFLFLPTPSFFKRCENEHLSSMCYSSQQNKNSKNYSCALKLLH